MTVKGPTVLTPEDFVEGRLANPNGCTLVIAHANLVGGSADEDDDNSDASELMHIALEVASDFPEMHVGLLNCVAHVETAEKLSVYVSEYGTRCAAMIFTDRQDPHSITQGGNNTAASLRHWALGILLASGSRPTISREEILIRLAYGLAQPPRLESLDPQWDDAEIRTMAIQAARETLTPLFEEWIPEFDAKELE